MSRAADPSEMGAHSPVRRRRSLRWWGCLPRRAGLGVRCGQPTLGDRFAGVQVGPVCCDLEPPDLGGDQGVFVGLSGGEGASGIQLHQIIFEHTFNIPVEVDSPWQIRHTGASGQHLTDSDNTYEPKGGSGVSPALVTST